MCSSSLAPISRLWITSRSESGPLYTVLHARWMTEPDRIALRVREITRMTMMASAPAMPQQQGGALRGFGVLGNRVCRAISRLTEANADRLLSDCLDHRTFTRGRYHGRVRQHHIGSEKLPARPQGVDGDQACRSLDGPRNSDDSSSARH
jgi:hypothetical protein